MKNVLILVSVPSFQIVQLETTGEFAHVFLDMKEILME
jgi:hypothetical protein